MTIEEIVSKTPINQRPMIDDSSTQPAHYMNDEQYAEYLTLEDDITKLSVPTTEERVEALEQALLTLMGGMGNV